MQQATPINPRAIARGRVREAWRTSGASGLGVQTGKEDGFGLSYGLGARWAFTPQWAAVIEWENHKLKFADGKQDVKMTTVGLQYRF